MSALSVLFLILPLPIAFAIYTIEEVLDFYKAKHPLRKRLTICGIIEVLVLTAVVCNVLVGGPYAKEVWAVFFLAFGIILIDRIYIAIKQKTYVNGLWSSILFSPLIVMGVKSIFLAFGIYDLMTLTACAIAVVVIRISCRFRQ